MGYVFEPLTTERFKCQIRESFPGVYLTLISIIEGVALGILATETFRYINDPNLAEPWVRFIPYSLISFSTLIIVFYNYSWFVGVFRWSPKIWDILIPFALGFSQIGPMFYLTNPRNWWLLMAIFCFVGAGAFGNTLYRCSKVMFGQNVSAYRRTRNTTIWNICIAVVTALACVSAERLSYMKSLHFSTEVILLSFLVICAALIIYRGEKFLKDLHGDFGLTR